MQRTIPIIHLRDTLLVSIQVELSDHLVNELKAQIAEEIVRRRVLGLVIEVSGVDTFDSYIARALRDIAQIASLMGVRTVVAGFDALTASTLVEMGVRMEGVSTALNLDAALEILAELRAERVEYERLVLEELGLDTGLGGP